MGLAMRFIAPLLVTALAGAAHAQGPQTPPSAYEAARGAPFGDAQAIAWDIVVASAEGAAGSNQVDAELGEDWAAWRNTSGLVQRVDLRAGRVLHQEGGALINVALSAEARRRLDLYTGLSRAGALDEITFGTVGSFHRVWLEAATGVAARSGEIEVRNTSFGFEAVFDNTILFSADYGNLSGSLCGDVRIDPDRRASALALIRHAVPVHPDAFNALQAREGLPCAFSYTVFSPDSPRGRFESWILRDSRSDVPSPSEAVYAALPQADLLGPAGQAALNAARGGAGDAPEPSDFLHEIQRLQETGDLAGAFLITLQENHHFGPCPEQAVSATRPACPQAGGLAQEAATNPPLAQLIQGLSAVRSRDHAQAVALLRPFIRRNDGAGAAARIIVANELVSWGREGLDAHPDLDPGGMLNEALVMDPYAPDTYWHLGRLYLAAGAPHAAWSLFDLGRALPGRQPTPLLAQVDALEIQIQDLAPDWINPDKEAESAQ